MTGTDYDLLRQSVMSHEGLRLKPYADTVGKESIGYGRNLTDKGISRAEAEVFLDHDLADAIVACQTRWPWFNSLDGPRQRVLAEMCYNLGPDGMATFTKMLAAVQAGQYVTAAAEMMHSVWATQVGARARRLASLMQNGDSLLM